jgi:hypothetical protein
MRGEYDMWVPPFFYYFVCESDMWVPFRRHVSQYRYQNPRGTSGFRMLGDGLYPVLWLRDENRTGRQIEGP